MTSTCNSQDLQIFYDLLENATEEQLQQARCTPKQQKALLTKIRKILGNSILLDSVAPSTEIANLSFPNQVVLYTDGASRGNPGPAGYGFWITDSTGKELSSGYGYLGETTNNVAEYEALFYGLQTCLQHPIKKIQIRADSELMIKQLNGQYRVKNPNLVPLYHKIQEQLKNITWSAQHIPREQNKQADLLANQGVDQNRW